MAIIISVTFPVELVPQSPKKNGCCTSTPKYVRLLAHSLHENLNFHIPGSNIYYYYWAKCANVWVFGLIWPLNRLPHLKLPSQKGNQWALLKIDRENPTIFSKSYYTKSKT